MSALFGYSLKADTSFIALASRFVISYCRSVAIPVTFSVVLAGVWVASCASFASAQSNWQAEWEKTLRAAESEGQVTLYGCCYEYDRLLEGFKKKYPKIKVSTVLASVKEVLAQK